MTLKNIKIINKNKTKKKILNKKFNKISLKKFKKKIQKLESNYQEKKIFKIYKNFMKTGKVVKKKLFMNLLQKLLKTNK